MMRWAILLICVIALAALPLTGNDVLVQYGIDALLFATLAQAWFISWRASLTGVARPSPPPTPITELNSLW